MKAPRRLATAGGWVEVGEWFRWTFDGAPAESFTVTGFGKVLGQDVVTYRYSDGVEARWPAHDFLGYQRIGGAP